MTASASSWRPPRIVRPVAIGVVHRRNQLLLMKVRDHSGATKGWRPLGGTIDFGELASDALKREFLEELGAPVGEPVLLSVFESLFTHNGAMGHEIVFAFETSFINPEDYQRESFEFVDGGVANEVEWVDLQRFRAGIDLLFPDNLLRDIDRRAT